jgi:metallo-beta-lactamase class B
VIFPVKDGSSTHVAGLFGGSILIPTRISDDGLRQYIQSIDRWATAAREANVDVEIQNHPLYDGFERRLQRLKQRAPGQPHPFAVGRDAYQRFLQVMSGCTGIQLARRGLS